MELVWATMIDPRNDGFEQPDLGGGFLSWQYEPSSPGWTFNAGTIGNSGIAANGSQFNLAGATNGNHDGGTSTVGQAALLQGGDGTLAGCNFSQTLTLPSGNWILLLSLEGREAQDGANGVNVFLDGSRIGGTLFPAHLGSFNDTSVNLGFLSGGNHTVAFAGAESSGDHTTFIDNVRFSTSASAPDYGSAILLLTISCATLFVFQRGCAGKRIRLYNTQAQV